jgi:hypothetical protein
MRAATAIRGTVALAGVAMLLLLALATAPWARASIIYVCVAKRGGAVHIVSKAARCRKRESKEPWNTRGSTGATGAVSTGGAAGINGFNGVAGATGAAGANAETGSPGGAGETGATGVAGTTGATGAQGPAGPTGETGATGVAGTKGATGASGAAGPAGATGETGAVGPTGAGGAVGGYSASNAGPVNFTLSKSGTPAPILTKEGIPAGSFIVYAKLVVTASDSEPGATWLAECTLTDKPGTVEDTAAATGLVAADHSLDNSETTLSLGMAVATTGVSKLTLACANASNSSTTGSFTLKAAYASITAVQTTQNS